MRDGLYGICGPLATFSGSLHELVGVIAGSLTIVFMSYKIWQEIKKRK